tara:strand:- start:84 stop:254 length:171 start_codon:yes stop_codon:yes gene_type:complete
MPGAPPPPAGCQGRQGARPSSVQLVLLHALVAHLEVRRGEGGFLGRAEALLLGGST